MSTHVVRQGESFATIARDHGFTRDALYSHADNSELRGKRPNPNVLHPGDRVAVPEKGSLKKVSVSAGTLHRFTVKLPKLELRIKLLDIQGKPIANETYTLQVGGTEVSGRTGADGRIAHTIGDRVARGRLTIFGRAITLQFGTINPLRDVLDGGLSGARERLRNLGYDVGAGGSGSGTLDSGTRTALALFQHHAGIAVTGKLDEATAAKLADAHGC
jgi:hypothetical protein